MKVAVVFESNPWWFKFLGLDYSYQMEVLDNPVECDEGFRYNVKIVGRNLKWKPYFFVIDFCRKSIIFAVDLFKERGVYIMKKSGGKKGGKGTGKKGC